MPELKPRINVEEPRYDYAVERLVKAYEGAIKRIVKELESIDLNDFSKAQSTAILKEVSKILAELNEESIAWIKEMIPIAITDGTVRTMVALGYVDTLEEAAKVAKFNKINNELVKIAVADTQTDLLAVTNNVEKRVRNAVRTSFSQALTEKLSAGVMGRKSINSETLALLRKKLGDSVNTGIVYANGRKEKPASYVDMLTRTKLMDIHDQSVINEAVSRKAFYGIISSHGAKDACRFHEGRIIKLTSEAEGSYPTYEYLRSTGQIFHHRCKHTITPLRTFALLPKSVKDKAEKQALIGDKATKTGKRNPSDEDMK